MTYLSIIEKLGILFNALLDFEFVLIFTVLLIIFTFLYIIKKLSSRNYMLCMILVFTLVFGISIVSNYEVLSNTFDDFTTIFFGNIYFPSIYVYIGILVINFVSFIVSILNVMLKKIYKVINSTMFIINNILFVIILNIIAKNKIDIFSVNSLYTDTSLVAILELSMGLFILWILSLVTIYVTSCICERIVSKKVRNTEIKGEKVIFNPILEVSNDINGKISSGEDNSPVLVPMISDVNVGKEVVNEITPVVESNQNVVSENINEEIASVVENIETITDNNVIEESTSVVESIQSTVSETVIEEITPVIENIETASENVIEENNIEVISDSVIESEDTECSDETVVTFNDILNGSIPVTYYDNNVAFEEHDLIDPQMIFEDKYNKLKNENVIFNSTDISIGKDIKENIELSVEEKTLLEKEKVREERLVINTISLNDLIDCEDVNVERIQIENKEQDKSDYTIDDYKKIIKMLNALKIHSNNTNINIDDAVAISLISNYSVDDCLKFKNILESNLN